MQNLKDVATRFVRYWVDKDYFSVKDKYMPAIK